MRKRKRHERKRERVRDSACRDIERGEIEKRVIINEYRVYSREKEQQQQRKQR